ncbi:hypothetical protein C6496_15780 [Candidatus Poribacteria bacterium]|nr:MAG: hypothetical protein C6496_15780 [Candidatus Poribacteria bacterium]
MRNKNTRFFILIYIFITCCLPASAEEWHDDFNAENPEAWRVVGNGSLWKVTDGFLRVEVKRERAVEYELYQFTAIPGPYRNFIVTINDFGGDKTRFGFCVGRHFPDTPEEDPFFYVFFPDEIRARRFDGKGSSHPFRTRLSREPRTRWETDALTEMKLYFNAGYFILFTDGKYRTTFQDLNFDEIEILGFVMEGINIANQWEGTAWADSFTISSLNITPEARLTSTWAGLKTNQ